MADIISKINAFWNGIQGALESLMDKLLGSSDNDLFKKITALVKDILGKAEEVTAEEEE